MYSRKVVIVLSETLDVGSIGECRLYADVLFLKDEGLAGGVEDHLAVEFARDLEAEGILDVVELEITIVGAD